jgi:hypothetical protein
MTGGCGPQISRMGTDGFADLGKGGGYGDRCVGEVWVGGVRKGEPRISRMGTNDFSNGSVRGLLERGCSARRQTSTGLGMGGVWGQGNDGDVEGVIGQSSSWEWGLWRGRRMGLR